MTARQASLFDAAHTQTLLAAEIMNMAGHTGKINVVQADNALNHLRAASAAWQTFRDLTAGHPEPQKG